MPTAHFDRLFAPALLLLALMGLTCAQEEAPRVPQWLVYIDTDAPVAGSLERAGVPPLFDRVRLEVLRDGESAPCETCVRIVSLDHDTLSRGLLSFGIAGKQGEDSVLVRARAFRSAAFPDGLPSTQASIDVTVRLPPLEGPGEQPVTVFLSTNETGAATSSIEEPGVPEPGKPKRSAVATWPGAERLPCTGEPWPDQVCVPGGAFWMPSAAMSKEDIHNGIDYDEQLVVLSPYYLSATEVPVGSLLRSGFVTTDWDQYAIASWSGDEEGYEIGSHRDWCTYGGALGRQDLPVSCIQPSFAREYCRSIGADLPTEAQLSYPMSGLESRRAPWGDEPPSCEDAWWGRGGGFSAAFLQGPCGQPGVFQALQPVGTSGRDRLELEDGTLEDLAGSLMELSRDRYATRESPCWPSGVAYDPECYWDEGDESAEVVLRGGDFADIIPSAVSTRIRRSFPTTDFLIEAGFRCVRPGDDTTPPPSPSASAWIGTGCVTDADCSSDPRAICLGPDDEHGIGGGYCSLSCASATDCPDDSVCAEGRCFLHCQLKKPELEAHSTPLHPGKCHGRRDLMCVDLSSAPAICYPACSSDAECGSRFCNHKLGSCTDTPSTGAEDGEACSNDSECRGYCVGVCASVCSSGGEPDSEDCGGSSQALCARYDTLGAGDIAYCAPACTTHDDCAMPATFCTRIFDFDDQKPSWWDTASNACLKLPTCTVEGQSCTAGLVCTQTPHGLYCLDPDIPPP